MTIKILIVIAFVCITCDVARILSKQERLNKVTAEVRGSKDRVDNYLKEKEEYFKKKRDVERLKMRVGLLQKQLQQRERLEKEGGWGCCRSSFSRGKDYKGRWVGLLQEEDGWGC